MFLNKPLLAKDEYKMKFGDLKISMIEYFEKTIVELDVVDF